MQPTHKTITRGHGRILPLAAALTLFAATVHAQQAIEAAPYGVPSACLPSDQSALGLYYRVLDGGRPALRLEGGEAGQPALIVFSDRQQETQLIGGATMLVGLPIEKAAGSFDAQGCFLHELSVAMFGEQDQLFAQGLQPASALGRKGPRLSGGLALTRKPVSETPAPQPGAPVQPAPSMPPVLVEEFAGLFTGGHFEAALDMALNSKDDALSLELGGNLEIPVFPGVTAGGKASFKSKIKHGEHDDGVVFYDLSMGTDVAASAGVGVGVAGLGASQGVGGEVIWRFASTHEVARALRSTAILLVVDDRLEGIALLVDSKSEELDRAIAVARRVADHARRMLRSWMPWSQHAFARRLQGAVDQQIARRRALVDGGRALIGWVATERRFLNEHHHGIELRATTAFEANVGTGIGDKKNGGEWTFANVGASLSASCERQFAVRAEKVPGSEAWAIEHKVTFTKAVAAAAGFGVGLSGGGKRVIELSHKMQVGGGSFDGGGVTVKLTLDGQLRAVVGAVITGQAGVGGEVVLQVSLEDLLARSAEAIAILLGDDPHPAATLLRSVTVGFQVRGRYEAGLAIGIGVDLDGVFKGGIGGSALMTDCGPGIECQGSVEDLIRFLAGGALAGNDVAVMERLDAVRGEVAAVMAR